MGKCYNIVFNSDTGAGTSGVAESFQFDWSKLPDKPYKVRFSFKSDIQYGDLSSGSQPALVFIDLNCSSNYIANSTAGNLLTASSFLGVLNFQFVANSYNATGPVFVNQYYFSAGLNDNTPTYLDTRPSSNNITIYVLKNDFASSAEVPVPISYTLVLNLEEQD